MDLDADDSQLDCPFVYASAKGGYAILELDDKPENMIPLRRFWNTSLPRKEIRTPPPRCSSVQSIIMNMWDVSV